MDTDVIERELLEFERPYPTLEESVAHNASVLYKRKKFFLHDLRTMIKVCGYLLLGLIYLLDMSLIFLIIRAFTHYTLSNPFPNPQMRFIFTDSSRGAIAKFLLVSVITLNVLCFLIHLVYGAYDSTKGDGYYQGGLTIQFIGENPTAYRIKLLFLDLFLFFMQLIYHSLMCVIEDSQVLEKNNNPDLTHDSLLDRNEEYMENGYSGCVTVLSIDLLKNVKTVLQTRGTFEIRDIGSQAMPI